MRRDASLDNKLNVVAVPFSDDNYAWLIHDSESDELVVVDPGLAAPVQLEVERRNWRISQIWLTHWHSDHVDGAVQLKAGNAKIIGPKMEFDKLPFLDICVKEGDIVSIGGRGARVMSLPGHTKGHVGFHLFNENILFSGDALFAMGCGRLFEGSPEDLWGVMKRCASLPAETKVYCGHENTAKNAAFARLVEPENQSIRNRVLEVTGMTRDKGGTIPFTIGDELETNPFMRAGSAERVGELRALKDKYPT